MEENIDKSESVSTDFRWQKVICCLDFKAESLQSLK